MSATGKAIVLVLIGILSIQGGAAFAKNLFPVVGPEGMTFLRIWFSALILAAIYKPWKGALTKKAIGIVILYGIALGTMNLVFYLSLSKIPLGIAVAIEFIGPLAVSIWASRKPRDFIWIALAALGIFLIYPKPNSNETIQLTGILLALCAGTLWGLYIILAKKLGQHIQGGRATALGMLVAAITVTPFSINSVTTTNFNISIITSAIAVAILSSALPYSLEMKALRNLPHTTFGILMSLEPAVAALCGLLFLKESLSTIQQLAILCIVMASFGSATLSNSSTATPEV